MRVSALARWLVAAGWLGLGLVKLPHPRDTSIHAVSPGGRSLEVLEVVAPFLEAGLGVSLLIPLRRWRIAHRATGLASIALAVALALFAWLAPGDASCGCFGVVGDADRWQRVVVALGLLYISVEALAPAPGRAVRVS